MRCSELVGVLPRFGMSPFQVCECAAKACDNTFAAIDGLAFPGRSTKDNETHLYFFCSAACYLNAMPAEACWQA
jgi:hypothetical protein